ncbi:MAG: hypothetical protein K9K66_01580 [Desulfarculaceae bacterium]|nr:hypothetical protein [Desulfarculaceae bacterium]MCF8072405.1 hypothetical protein [Desulfarculaceae bacterium]MCF8100326.1 hypothetical protein [Desulfarculaceae bacterium]MCF8117907.1 hypothetical protein [Desulfarculaceae bacterium]
MLRRFLPLLSILCLLMFAFACKEASMAVPTDLSVAAQTMKVEQTRIIGWDSPFDFGPYQVSQVQRGWTESTAWGFMIYESYKAEQSYQYAVTKKGKKPWQCNCATNVNQQVLEGMVGGGKLTWELGAGQTLACSLKSPTGDLWRMALAASGRSGEPMQGLLVGPKLTITVQGTDKLEGSSIPLSEPTGYVFSVHTSTSGPVAAVQVINNGVLWLPHSPDADALAAASAALLLHQNVDRKN